MFVWVEVFALIVGFLCACGVRRLYDLWRVCLYFVLFCPLSCPLFCPFALVFAFLFTSLLLLSLFVLLSSACPLSLPSLSLWVVGFLSLSDGFRYKKKGRVLRPFLWSCVVVLECFWNYETIVGGFNSKRVPCYPCNCKKIATM